MGCKISAISAQSSEQQKLLALENFIATKNDFDWFYKKAIDVSRGKILSSHLSRFSSGQAAVEKIKEQGYQIAVTTLRESVMQSFAQVDDRPIAIVFGNETSGVSIEMEDAAEYAYKSP